MQEYRLAYGSTVVDRLTKDDLRQILSTSVRNNEKVHVTGVLCFTRGMFFQILEGGRYPINKTFQRISLDKRHKDVVMIGMEPIASRAFAKWSMAYVDDSAATGSIIFKHSGADRIVLDYMTLAEAVALGTDLIKSRA